MAATASGDATLEKIKVVIVALLAVASGTATFTRQIGRRMSIAATGDASYSRSIARSITAACSVAVSRTRTIGRTISRAATGSGSLSRPAAYARALAATVTGTASVRRYVSKTVGTTANAGAVFVRGIFRSMKASVAVSPRLLRRFFQDLAVDATATASLAAGRLARVVLATATTISASFVRSISLVRSAQVSIGLFLGRIASVAGPLLLGITGARPLAASYRASLAEKIDYGVRAIGKSLKARWLKQ